MSLTTETPSPHLSKNIKPSTLEESLEIAHLAAEAALDKKAERVKILNLSESGAFADYFVICSGSNDRQVRAIVDSVEQGLKAKGHRPRSSEGVREGRWVVVDCGDVIVHVFLDAIRNYYNLEGLWSKAEEVMLREGSYGSAATRSS